MGGANGESRSIFRGPGAAQHIGVQLEAARWRAAARADGRDDRGGDHRRKRRVRAQHEDPRSPDHRVRQETRDARIQARDRGESRELRVRHPLRHQQRHQHQPGDDVVGEPGATVAGEGSTEASAKTPRGSYPITWLTLMEARSENHQPGNGCHPGQATPVTSPPSSVQLRGLAAQTADAGRHTRAARGPAAPSIRAQHQDRARCEVAGPRERQRCSSAPRS